MIDHKLGASEDEVLDLSQHKIEVVLSETEIEQLEASDPSASGLAVTVNALDLASPVPKSILQSAAILCLEVNPHSQRSTVRVGQVRDERPDLPIIALVRDANVALVRTLLRQGVSDVVELPLSVRQLTESVGDILAGMQAKPVRAERKAGRLISVVKSIGGVGATNVAVNLAATLSADGDNDRACLFDLDVQFGNAATYLGAAATPSLSELLDGGARVDGDFLRTVTSRVANGASFVPAPPDIEPIETVNEAQLRRILRTARGEFDYVIADLPANWANWTLSVVAQSDLVILVVNLSIASLRQGKRQLQLLRSQGVDPARIVVLVNRIEQRLFKTIGLDDAAKALGHPVTLAVHNDYPLMSAANNQGIVVGEFNKRSKVARDFARIAATVTELVDEAVQ